MSLQGQSTWDLARALRLSQLDPGTVAAAIDNSIYEGYEAEAQPERISCPAQLMYGDLDKGYILTQEQIDVIRSSIPDCVADLWMPGRCRATSNRCRRSAFS